jgi:hypothetical protein
MMGGGAFCVKSLVVVAAAMMRSWFRLFDGAAKDCGHGVPKLLVLGRHLQGRIGGKEKRVAEAGVSHDVCVIDYRAVKYFKVIYIYIYINLILLINFYCDILP